MGRRQRGPGALLLPARAHHRPVVAALRVTSTAVGHAGNSPTGAVGKIFFCPLRPPIAVCRTFACSSSARACAHERDAVLPLLVTALTARSGVVFLRLLDPPPFPAWPARGGLSRHAATAAFAGRKPCRAAPHPLPIVASRCPPPLFGVGGRKVLLVGALVTKPTWRSPTLGPLLPVPAHQPERGSF